VLALGQAAALVCAAALVSCTRLVSNQQHTLLFSHPYLPIKHSPPTQAYDWEDASITDSALIKFLADSEQWLDSLVEVDLKKCHHVTPKLLAFLRGACPKLRKLAPSRWADHAALRDIAAFPCLEVRPAMRPAVTLAHLCRCLMLAQAGDMVWEWLPLPVILLKRRVTD
jgi:hypothetical protein